MTAEEGARRLRYHTLPQPDAFLGTLRPFRALDEAVLADLLAALRASAPLFEQEQISRELVGSALAIVHLGRTWAVLPGGMLRSNGLIAEAEVRRLDDFLHAFSQALFSLLDGCGSEVAFEGFDDRR